MDNISDNSRKPLEINVGKLMKNLYISYHKEIIEKIRENSESFKEAKIKNYDDLEEWLKNIEKKV